MLRLPIHRPLARERLPRARARSRGRPSASWRDGKRRKSGYYEGPLAVIINRLSASASEILAGALQDYGRGIIVGGQSFGKGTVQSLVPLKEGQLKITESKFYRISGHSTQHRGVLPDIYYPSLFDPSQIGESSLTNALSWDQIPPARFNRFKDLGVMIPLLNSLHEKRTKNDPDFRYLQDQVEMARQSRAIDSLPLLESGRIALRNKQQSEALKIENRRRSAKGLELLDSLDTPNSENQDTSDIQVTSIKATDAEDTVLSANEVSDVLLLETGRILVDSITFQTNFVCDRISHNRY